MNTEIQVKDIRDIAEKVLIFLDEQGITDIDSLQSKIGEEYPLNDEAKIAIEMRPSDWQVDALTLSYITLGLGVPLECRLNPPLSYYRILLKAKTRIQDYACFSTDDFGNIIQAKIRRHDNLFETVKEELEYLSRTA